MRIFGLQKLTLLDFPGKVACTVFTGGCNLRCPFCHNASLVAPAEGEIPEKEVLSFLESRKKVLDGVCITGGEPLLWPDIGEFIEKIKALGLEVKLDTNGCFPERLAGLMDEKLVDHVAMDIKTSPGNYAKVVGIPEFDVSPVLRSAGLLMQGKVPFEFRTTVVAELHSEEDFEAIADRFAGDFSYYIQSFKDSGDILSKEELHAYPKETLERFLQIVSKKIPKAELRGV